MIGEQSPSVMVRGSKHIQRNDRNRHGLRIESLVGKEVCVVRDEVRCAVFPR